MKQNPICMSLGKSLKDILTRRVLLVLALIAGLIFSAFAQQGGEPVGTVNQFYQSLHATAGNTIASIITADQSLNLIIDNYHVRGNEEIFSGKEQYNTDSYAFFTFSDNDVKGKVILKNKRRAYDYYSKAGVVYVLSVNISSAICMDFPKAQNKAAQAPAPAPPPGSDIYNLQSLPGATAVVMLDFDGHDATGSWWGNIVGAPANVTEAEIYESWRITSEDFRPFNLNITTNEQVYQSAPSNRRMRCIITPTTDANPGSGGVAFIGSFTSGGELAPCWVFNLNNGKVIGETISHEVGHTVGLFHDGRDFPDGSHEEYYGGNEFWAPIMGVSFSPAITQWSKGEYEFANNFQDDIQVIVTGNGFGFRPDAQGDTRATAAPLAVQPNGTVQGANNYGIIANQPDIDFFSFTSAGGGVSLTVSPSTVHPDLDLTARIVNSSGATVVSSNPARIGSAVLNASLAAGTYYLIVDGVGFGNPFNTGYSDYSSIGEFTVSGNIAVAPGITGPTCVVPGVPYVFTLNPGQNDYYGISWWVSGDATVQVDPNNPLIATITFTQWNGNGAVINANVNFNSAPWYHLYTLSVQVGNCDSPLKASAGTAQGTSPSQQMKVKVLDLNGRELLSAETDEPDAFIEDQSLPSGIYLMYVSDGVENYIRKIVK